MDERWSFTAISRYQTFSTHDRMVLTLAAPVGSGLGDNGVRSRVGAGVRVATSAVPLDRVTPAAVDGPTYEPHIMGEVSWHGFSLRGGYAFAFMPQRTVTESAFSTADAVTCKNTGYDLNSPSCNAYKGGNQRPSANGRYNYVSHTLSLSMVARF